MSERLADHTTLGVGGPARRILQVSTEPEFITTVADCDRRGEPVLVLGDGSNVLCGDAGFPGTVVLANLTGLTIETAPTQIKITAGCGESWDDLVRACVERGWAGIEAMSGIPGRVGATPIQNVGAYGQEASASIVSVRAYDRRSGVIRTLDAQECDFGYRTSTFKAEHDRWLILAVTYRLAVQARSQVRYGQLADALGIASGEAATGSDIRDAVLRLRRSKGMLVTADDPDSRSAGSFFTNPILDAASADTLPPDCPRYPLGSSVKVSAAWLIEQAGIRRGWSVRPGAPARISGKHTLALVNAGGSSAADVLELAEAVRSRVLDRFGVTLEPEVQLVQCSLDSVPAGGSAGMADSQPN